MEMEWIINPLGDRTGWQNIARDTNPVHGFAAISGIFRAVLILLRNVSFVNFFQRGFVCEDFSASKQLLLFKILKTCWVKYDKR